MKLKYAYEGTLNGVKGVWSDECPDAVIVEREIVFITPEDLDNELQNKETKERRASVIIQDESEMDNWEEVEREKFPLEKEIDNG